MNPLIKPIFYLMNQLNYRSKIALICSVFAIPLAFFAAQLAYTYHQKSEQAQFTLSGLTYINQANALISDLETLRDSVVVISWRSNSFLASDLMQVKKRIYRKISALLAELKSEEHRKYLLSLRNTLELDAFVRGNESERIDGVYDDAHIMLNKAYVWRSKLAYSFISGAANDKDVVALLNLLNENEAYSYALGQVRSFGAFYLEQKFIESQGVESLEKSYQKLNQLTEGLEVKFQEYAQVVADNPSIGLDGIRSALLSAQKEMNEKLIEVPSLSADAGSFYQRLTELYQVVYQHNRALLMISEELLEQDYLGSLQRLVMFYVSVVIISAILLYLSLGFYRSVNSAISELTESADRVASGDYDKSIDIAANDELKSVAVAMEHMRQSIKEREEKLERMSQVDGLTQLYNRPFFDQALEISLANSRRNLTPLSIVMMDIDHFKRLNDNYGHQAGDECLRQIAHLMKEQYQRKTDVVARYGGEEFIVILYGQTLEDALAQTEKLRHKIESHQLEFDGSTITFTASFGLVSICPPVVLQSKQLVGRADELLYQAKESGRNRICSACIDDEANLKSR